MRDIIVFLAALSSLSMAIDVSGCRAISSAGTYDLVSDLQGANITASEYTSAGMACLKVTAPNVVIDCHGHSISDNTSNSSRYGIMVRASNVQVRNCVLSGYNGSSSTGMFFHQSATRIYGFQITNISSSNNYYGLFTYDYDTTNGGVTDFNLTNSSFYGNRYGVYMSAYATRLRFEGNNASDNLYSGFQTSNLNARNSSFINNIASNNHGNTSTTGGFYLEGMNYNITIINNTAEGNGYYGIYFRSLNTTVANNVLNGNGAHGMYADPFFSGPSYYIIQNNTACGNGMYGMVQYGYSGAGSDLSFFNNTACSNGLGGFVLYGPLTGSVNSNLAENNSGSGLHISSYFGGDGGTPVNVTFDANRAYNNTYGISVYSGASPPSMLSFLNNTALESTKFDFYVNLYDISSTAYCDVLSLGDMTSSGGRPIILVNESGEIRDIEAAELILCDADNSTLANVTIHGSDLIPNNGISLHKTDNSTFENLTLSDDYASFDLVQSHGNRFRDIEIEGSVYGVNNYHYFVSCCPTFRSSENNTFTDMNLTGCGTAYYFDFNSLGRSNVTGGLIADSTGPGLVANTSLLFVNGTRFCGNNPDVRVWADTGFAAYIGLNISNAIFDGPSCSLTNFTNLSLYDSGSTANYSIDWSAVPPSPPAGRFPFKGMLNFTRFSSSSIDRMTYNWRDDELSGASESAFRLYRYDGAWTSVNSTPSTSLNTLSLFSVSTFSVYGILGQDSAPAVALNSPPSYSEFFNETSLDLSFTATDNSPVLNCTLYLDSGANQTNDSVEAGNATVFPVSGLSEGWHLWYVGCSDTAGNTGMSTVWYFTTDNSAPEVFLSFPENGSSIPQGEADPLILEYYADDAQSYMQSCSLFLDGQLNDTAYEVYSGEGYPFFEVYGLQPGLHNWSVECNDSFYSGASETWSFEIFVPSYLCDARLLVPSGDFSVVQNATFDVISSVGCCGGTNNCSGVTATLDPPDYTMQTCSGVWGFQCGDGPEPGDNTFDSCSPEGGYPDEHVSETYLNATTVSPGDALEITCEFDCIYDGDYAYAWYHDGTGWVNLASWDWGGTGFGCDGPENLSAAFTAGAAPGIHIVRCGISYAPDDDECADSDADYHDNDDINFTVEGGEGSKGAVPVGSGEPFFTMGPNPASEGCLAGFAPGTECNTSWTVNATGAPSTSWEFFVVYERPRLQSIETGRLNVSIVEESAPEEPEDEDEPEEEKPPLSVSVSSSCEENTVSVMSEGEPVDGAVVLLNGLRFAATDAAGQASFDACGKVVEVSARRSGYEPASIVKTLVSCDECGGMNQTEIPELAYECYSDADCDPADYCLIMEGSAGGTCEPVAPGACGEVRNHSFAPFGYECGSEPGCPSCPAGDLCQDHSCLSYALSGPENVPVNGTAPVHAANSTGACRLCDLVIVDPAGKTLGGRTDANGDFVLPASLKGIYNVTLLIDGKPYRSILINAFPLNQPEEPEKPSSQSPGNPSLLWLLLLLIAIILAVVYWRRRKKTPTS